MRERTTTCRDILTIQAKQLKEWESVLKPEVFQKVKAEIEARTQKVPEADLDKAYYSSVGLQGVERYDIPRGTYIDEAVGRQKVRE